MEDDLDRGILHECAEARRRRDGERVDDRVPLARGELDQVDAVDVPMEARAFGVEREDPRLPDLGEPLVDFGGGVEVRGGGRGSGHRRNLHALPHGGRPATIRRTPTGPTP